MAIFNTVYGGDGRWKPGSNTLAYYPLDSTNTVNDLSGNNRNLSNNGVTFGTNYGVDSATVKKSTYLSATASWLPSGKSALTVSVRVYYSSISSGNYYSPFSMGDANHKSFTGLLDSGYISLTDYGDSLKSDVTAQSGQRYYLTFTAQANSNVWKIYVNGVERTTSGGVGSYAGLSGTNFRINGFFWAPGNGVDGALSRFIFEDKEWTADEVAKYYNSTKGNY